MLHPEASALSKENMNTRREFRHHAESKQGSPRDIGGDDFNANRVSNKLRIKTRRESGNRPQGNYEYEQMIAEDVGFGVHRMIEEAAFFIAMRRGFYPGNELADWLQAETDIDSLLHGAAIDNGEKVADDHIMKPLRTETPG